MRVAINGLGRMGRCLFRAMHVANHTANNGQFGPKVVAINCTMTPEACAYFIKWDSIHGCFNRDISYGNDWIAVDGGDPIKIINCINIRDINWQNIDLVAECTGKFKNYEQLKCHIDAGVNRVVLSAPFEDKHPELKTVLYGVNHKTLSAKDKIISASSCTSNALVPIVDVVHKKFGITSGFFVTVHAYTNDQNILDSNHKDFRRARAAAISMIPTSTGAHKTVTEVFPELKGKISGRAIRVPVPDVSLIDFTFSTTNDMTVASLESCFQNEVVIGSTKDPLVSVDFIGNTKSSIVDLNEIVVITPNQARIMAWYDNEWGFVSRMVDIIQYLASI